MFTNNQAGEYPSVLFHRSHRGQLVIGGAMLNRFENEGMEEASQAVPSSGGWRTRFDGGTARTGVQDLPCDLVAMYVEGLIHISGYEGAYDSEVEIEPSCYAVVVFRWMERKDIKPREQTLYLQSHFSFCDRVQHDGVYDMKNAVKVATQKGFQRDLNDRSGFVSRRWHLVGKKNVPGHVRQVLHKTLKTVDQTVDDNFGQGKKFFQLPERRK